MEDQTSEQGQFEFALGTVPLRREAWQRKCGVRRSTAPVRRILCLSECPPPRPQRRAAQADRERVRDWQERKFTALASRAREPGATPVCADESGLDSPCVSGRTGGRRGRTPTVQVAQRRFRLPMLAARSPAGDLDDRVREGRVTAQACLELLKQLGREAGGRVLLVGDNASIPTVQAVRAWTAAHAAKCEMHRQPSYAPPGNPGEQLRALGQRKVRRQLSRTKVQLRENPEAALRTLQAAPELGRAFLREADCRYMLA